MMFCLWSIFLEENNSYWSHFHKEIFFRGESWNWAAAASKQLRKRHFNDDKWFGTLMWMAAADLEKKFPPTFGFRKYAATLHQVLEQQSFEFHSCHIYLLVCSLVRQLRWNIASSACLSSTLIWKHISMNLSFVAT